jgi:[acyl-carrier-protein] S-malonyltransferase
VSLALLFPGQGTQHAGMLPWLEAHAAARPVLARMAERLAAPDWRERLADAPWAQSNPVAQPLLTGVSLAAWAVLAPGLPAPAAVLGYSVGELPAGAVAGLYDADAALALAQARAACMDAAAPAEPTGLLSVGGLPWQAVADQVAADGLHPSIVREADQLLLGGPVTALHAWAPRLEAQGARCTPIGARIASHTPGWPRPCRPGAPICRPNAGAPANRPGGQRHRPGGMAAARAARSHGRAARAAAAL